MNKEKIILAHAFRSRHTRQRKEDLMSDIDELQHEREAALRGTAESGEGRLIIQGVAVIERNSDLVSQGVDTIEQTPHTFTEGADTIEQTPHSFTIGADTIERNAEG